MRGVFVVCAAIWVVVFVGAILTDDTARERHAAVMLCLCAIGAKQWEAK